MTTITDKTDKNKPRRPSGFIKFNRYVLIFLGLVALERGITVIYDLAHEKRETHRVENYDHNDR